jgi:hypothetical protein
MTSYKLLLRHSLRVIEKIHRHHVQPGQPASQSKFELPASCVQVKKIIAAPTHTPEDFLKTSLSEQTLKSKERCNIQIQS